MPPTYWVAECPLPYPIDQRQLTEVVETLDQLAYCISWGGSLIGGKWDGHSTHHFEGVTVVKEKFKFWVVGTTRETVERAVAVLKLPVQSLSESGPRESWQRPQPVSSHQT